MNKDPDKKNSTDDNSPPLFGSWNKLYGLVFLTFAVLVLLFYLFTKAFE